MNVSSLYIMLPASMLGAMRISAGCDRRLHAFDPRRLLVDGNVEIERTIDDAADDLPTIGHLGESAAACSGCI